MKAKQILVGNVSCGYQHFPIAIC